jgi:hypothetical protein
MTKGALVLGIASLAVTADAGTIRVDVGLKRDKDGKCAATVSSPDAAQPPVKLKRSRRDMLTWNITNACPRQRVRICIIPTDGGSTTRPIDECAADPDDAEPYDEFVIEGPGASGAGHATISCRLRWRVLDGTPKALKETKREYAMEVAVGLEAAAECPPRKRRLSELAMEIEP